ncbi:phage tail tip lysozyme [Paraburkholderia sediminicola]|uniref:phage tail tip lysozyme n=1 Tax=Paraburkholderia sediminicola TaxID=458836 RepID=UPI0038BC53F8
MANEFVIRIRADDAATATVNKIKAALSKVTEPVEKVQKRVGTLGDVGQSGLTKLRKGLDGVASSASKVVDKIVEIIPGLTAIGGAASIAGLSALAVKFGNFGFSLNKNSKLLGMNAQDLAAWHVAAKRAGVSAEEFDSSMSGSQMAIRNAAFGADPHAMVLLNKMGVQIAKNKDGTTDYYATQMRLMDAIPKLKTVEAQRDVAGTFGMGALMPMLQQGTYAADKARAVRKGLVPTPEEIARAQAFHQDVNDLEDSVSGLGNSIGSRLIPVLDPLITGMSKWLDSHRADIADKITTAVQKFADWVSNINWDAVTDKAGKLFDAMGGIKGVALTIAALTFAGPIASVLSLISNLTLLATTTIPRAAGALASLASAPVMAAILALLYSKGLNSGEDDYLKDHQAQPGQEWTGDAAGATRAQANTGSVTDRQKYLFARFKADGYTDAQAAGQIGSLMQEDSTLDPTKVNPKSGAAGFGQWLGPRAEQFQKMFGHSVAQGTFGEQTDFYLWEMKNSEWAADKRIRNADTPAQAAAIHAKFYERPGADEANIAQRQAYAESLYASLPKAAAADSSTASQGQGEPDHDAQVAALQGAAPGGHDSQVAALQSSVPQITLNVHNALPGTTVEAKTPDGGYLPTKVNYALRGADGAAP